MNFKSFLDLKVNGVLLDYKFFETLKALDKYHSQRAAARDLGIAHTVLNRRIRNAEDKLSGKLVEVSNSGSYLTGFAREILDKYESYDLRLYDDGVVTVAGGYVSCEFIRALCMAYNMSGVRFIQTDMDTAFNLANMGFVDILGFDDPVQAYIYDLEPVALGRDYFVMTTHDDESFDSVDDLDGLSFVEVEGSAQRLVWNTLDDYNVDFDIVSTVGSYHEALSLADNDENIYTFINNSLTYTYTNTLNILEDKTYHTISALNVKNDSLIESFLNFASHNAQNTTVNFGFKHLLEK